MPTGSALFDSTNNQNSSESEEEEEKEKPLCRPESDEDLSVEYWHIQKLVDDLKVHKLSGLIVTLDSFTLLKLLNLKSPQIYTLLQKKRVLARSLLIVMLKSNASG